MHFISYKTFGIFLICAMMFVAAGVFAANQIKTTETFVMSRETTLNPDTQATSTFSLYIGDSLAGVSNPVKSSHIAVSGVYTGNGSIDIQLGSDLQTFTMANVGTTPTPFEILYDASSTTAAISSAGTYNYTLTVTPSGVTIYGLSAKMAETHEYIPGSCVDGQPNNKKIKTTETFVMSRETTLNPDTQATSTFSLYIGDSLAGVSNPVKSSHIAVSGVYTGNGSIDIQLGSDLQTFTMANVGTTPTPFEILYDASSTTAAISSAGTYNYTLTVTPSGVTIYGLSAKMAETHRYKPPACGGAYVANGSVESSTFDTGLADGAAYNSLIWTGPSLPSDTKVRLQLATSNSSSGPWTYYGDTNGDGTCTADTEYYEPAASTTAEILCRATHNNKRYFRYKITLCSKSSTGCVERGDNTPQVDDVVINWSP